MRYVQRTGQGVDIIFREMVSMGKPYPSYRVFNDAVDFISKSVGINVKYCIVDALDEVESNQFSRVFREIKDFCENNKNTNVVFSCRKHYVASYAHIFSLFTDLSYIEIL